MFNPAKLLQFKSEYGKFEARHPKFVLFMGAIMKSGVPEGSVIEMKITYPDGREMESNLKVTAEDAEFLKSVGEMGQK